MSSTRVEVARQAGVCYYSPTLLEDKATQLKLGGYDTLAIDVKKRVVDQVEQEYLAYLFLNNSNVKLHSQLKNSRENTRIAQKQAVNNQKSLDGYRKQVIKEKKTESLRL